MTEAIDFRSLSALLQQKNTATTGYGKVVSLLGKSHVLPTMERKWRSKEESSIVIGLLEHLPKTLKNLTLSSKEKRPPEARELEVLTFIGFRLLGSKLFQLSLLRTWTDGLGERNKQLMVYALKLARQDTRPPAVHVKPERFAAKPSEQAVLVIAAMLNGATSSTKQPSPLLDIRQYIEEYHVL